MIGSGVSPESVIVLFSRSKTALILVGMSLFFCVKKTKEMKKISIFFLKLERFKTISILISYIYIYIYEINASQNKKENFSCKKAKIGKKDKES